MTCDSRAANWKKVVRQGGGMGKGRNEDLTVTRRKGLSRVWKNREGYLYWGGGGGLFKGKRKLKG